MEPLQSCAVREAADLALAMAAHDRTSWSQAVLSTQALKVKLCKRWPTDPACSKKPFADAAEKKRSSVLQRKARVLGRLVLGCHKLSFQMFLEAFDYIVVLEMQVHTMSTITKILLHLRRAAI